MEMHRNKMDNLFKKGLSEEGEAYNEEHWIALESMLDSRNKKPIVLFSKKWITIAAATILVVMAGILVNEVYNNDLSTENNQVLATKNKTLKYSKKPETKVSIVENKDVKIAGRKQVKLGSTKDVVTTISAESVGYEKIVTIETREDTLINTATVKTIPKPNITDDAKNSQAIKPFETFASTETSMVSDTIKVENPTLNKDLVEQVEKTNSSGLTLAIVAAPDFTSVRGATTSSLSQNAGILLYKPINNRISIGSGLVYSWKNYSSPYNLYNPEQKVTMREYPTDVDAKCRILTIPITVQYSIIKSPTHQIKIGIGTSNYFMLNEQYAYKYITKPNWGYEIKGENKHLFGTADFSISYERKLKFLTIGVQPFYQFPLKGVGYGRMNLQSKGVALSLRFGLGKN